MTVAARVDVAVVGGGPAGAAAAHAAAGEGCHVVLIERATGERRSLGESLPPVAGRLLRAVFGTDSALRSPLHLASYGSRAAWGSDAVVSNDFVLDPDGQGWHLDRAGFDAALREAARDRGVDVWTDTDLRSLTPAQDGWILEVAAGAAAHGVEAAVVVDATGRPATAARAAGAQRQAVDRLVAAVARLFPTCSGEAEVDLDATTLVEAVERGWWFTSPLPDGQRVVAFLTDGDLLDGHGYRTGDGWSAGLRSTRYVGEVVASGRYRCGSPPILVAADTARLDPVFGPRWIATGDAAASFDPLSSLGILTAVDFGATAGSAAVALVTGDTGPATAYARRVAKHVHAYMAERERVYATERRWPASPFWQRRTGSGDD